MKYLISEVEFYEPTIEQFKSKVIVVRRDQLEGEKLYIAPFEITKVAASFSDSENTIDIPNFADLILYFRTINVSFSYDSDTKTISVICDDEAIELTYIESKFLMEVDEFGPNCRNIYDFMESLGLHIVVATTLPKTINLNEQSEGEEVSPDALSEAINGLETSKPDISDEEREAVINDSKEEGEEPVKVELVDTVEEMIDK